MTKKNNTKKVFIVDDHPVFRGGLCELVRREPGLTVCGEAYTAAEALAAVKKLKPDLALVDIGLPGKSGLDLVKDIQSACPATAVLVISMHDEKLYAERVLCAGGRGYVMKQEGPEKILQAIRQVLGGQIAMSPKISTRLLDGLADRRDKSSWPISRLSERESEILEMIGEGQDSHAIARELNLSIKTVDAHRTHLKEKLNLSSGTQLICYAARWVERQQTSVV